MLPLILASRKINVVQLLNVFNLALEYFEQKQATGSWVAEFCHPENTIRF